MLAQIGQIDVAPKPIVAIEKVTNFLHKATFARMFHSVHIYEGNGIFLVGQSRNGFMKFDFAANIWSGRPFDACKVTPNFAGVYHGARQKFQFLQIRIV